MTLLIPRRVSSLNGYSKAAFDVFSEEFPELGPKFCEQQDGSLFMESASPSGSQFWISTESNGVTVGFDVHHAHFGMSGDGDATEDAREAVAYIHKLMCGDYVLAVWSRRGKYTKSEILDRGVNPEDVQRPWLCRWFLKGCTVEVRGW